MGDNRVNILHYGHLGTPTYLPDSQTWVFSRNISKGRLVFFFFFSSNLHMYTSADCLLEPLLTYLGHTKVEPAAPEQHGFRGIPEREELRIKKRDALFKSYPELAPGLPPACQYEPRSRSIASTVAKFDPLVSDLLALGNATIYRSNRARSSTVPIVVFVSSNAPIELRLAELKEELVEWYPDGGYRANVPRIWHRTRVSWPTHSGPVQQVRFSEAIDEKSIFMAVRSALSTIIFRPLHHDISDDLQPDGRTGADGVYQHVRLDANQLIEIPISLTGGKPHADVSFNPWYQQQVAIIDHEGMWSIWDIQKRSSRTQIWHVNRGLSGSLAENDQFTTESEHFDGWAAILWVGSVHRILACNRRSVVLFRFDTEPVERYSIDIGLERQSEWILDIRRSPSNPSHVFLVTTSRVFWLTANPDNFHSQSNSEASILLSWRHFRDLDDISLRLTSLPIEHGKLYPKHSQGSLKRD